MLIYFLSIALLGTNSYKRLIIPFFTLALNHEKGIIILLHTVVFTFIEKYDRERIPKGGQALRSDGECN